jgi:hypothetical protein
MRALRQPNPFCNLKTYSLHRGRSRHAIVSLVPCAGLYRIAWPDIGLSDLTNLTRAKAAAREWAEQKAMTEDRKLPVARRLKSLDNFLWSSSYIAQNITAAA